MARVAKKALPRKTCASFAEPEAGNMLRQKDFIARITVVVAFAALVLILFGTLFIASGFMAAAHEADGRDSVEEGEKEGFGERVMLDEHVRQNTMRTVLAGAGALVLLVAAAAFVKRKTEKGKGGRKASPVVSYLLFCGIVAVVVAVTAYITSLTIYLNFASPAKGPVHWHADFEVWRCGEQLELVDPEGFSNRVGSSVLHEHGDNRMHIEGVVVDYRDVSIGSFFRSVGGDLHQGVFGLPTDAGIVTMRDGDSCPDEAGMPGKLQVFAYKTVNGKMVQEKLDPASYEEYVPSPFGNVPPGDCIILEFASETKDKTERICESYHVALKRGAISGETNGDVNGG